MKFLTFLDAGKIKIGLLKNETVFEITGPGLPESMKALIQGGSAAVELIRLQKSLGRLPSLPLSDVKVLAPIDDPQKVVAIGHNYMDHIREQNASVPTHPMVFAKFPSSIIGPGETITWDPEITQQVDIEVELGIVIGKRARKVKRTEALDYVFGYTVLNDVSARDVQYGDKQWVRGKSLDTFCPLGPVIVTADEIPNPHELGICSKINEFVMQDSSTSEMIFDISFLVSFLSHSFTLEPGDIIASGTPNGVGVFRNPQVFLKDGDVVTVEVEKIGRLQNPVRLASAK